MTHLCCNGKWNAIKVTYSWVREGRGWGWDVVSIFFSCCLVEPIVGNPRVILIDSLFHHHWRESLRTQTHGLRWWVEQNLPPVLYLPISVHVDDSWFEKWKLIGSRRRFSLVFTQWCIQHYRLCRCFWDKWFLKGTCIDHRGSNTGVFLLFLSCSVGVECLLWICTYAAFCNHCVSYSIAVLKRTTLKFSLFSCMFLEQEATSIHWPHPAARCLSSLRLHPPPLIGQSEFLPSKCPLMNSRIHRRQDLNEL